jgi:hypothetical protein
MELALDPMDRQLLEEFFGAAERTELRSRVAAWAEIRRRRSFEELREQVMEDCICLRAVAGLARDVGLDPGARRLVRAANMAWACRRNATRLSTFQWGRASRAVIEALDEAIPDPLAVC